MGGVVFFDGVFLSPAYVCLPEAIGFSRLPPHRRAGCHATASGLRRTGEETPFLAPFRICHLHLSINKKKKRRGEGAVTMAAADGEKRVAQSETKIMLLFGRGGGGGLMGM